MRTRTHTHTQPYVGNMSVFLEIALLAVSINNIQVMSGCNVTNGMQLYIVRFYIEGKQTRLKRILYKEKVNLVKTSSCAVNINYADLQHRTLRS